MLGEEVCWGVGGGEKRCGGVGKCVGGDEKRYRGVGEDVGKCWERWGKCVGVWGEVKGDVGKCGWGGEKTCGEMCWER